MKRYIALFTATLILVANCIVYTPVKAVGTSVDFAEMFSEYLSLAEMSMALTQGVEIDWSGFEFDENTTNQDKAKALLNYYYSLIYNGLDFFLDLSGNYDVISEQMAAIGLQTSGNLSSDNIQDLRSQVSSALQNYAITGNWNIPIMQHYDDVCIAYWNKYNSLYINDYLDTLNYTDSDEPIPTPDYDYITILSKIETNYWDSNFISSNDYSNYSYVFVKLQNSNPYNVISLDNAFDSNSGYCCVFPAGSISVYIISNNDTFSFSYTPLNKNNQIPIISNNNTLYTFPTNYVGGLIRYTGFGSYGTQDFNNDLATGYFGTTFNSLQDCLNAVSNYFNHVNIFVDGVLWASAGNNISSGLTFNVPNAVIDSGTDDGKILAHPIYYPDAVKTDGLVNIDLDLLKDSIIDAIANGQTFITIDDVVDAGAAVKVNGTSLTDADTKTLDASIPIEAAKADTLSVPIGQIPGLPKLPPIIPPGGTSVPNGFSGMSVLARIINVTVQSVPQPLIMCFFGVIFGMVVLGIIKILHH